MRCHNRLATSLNEIAKLDQVATLRRIDARWIEPAGSPLDNRKLKPRVNGIETIRSDSTLHRPKPEQRFVNDRRSVREQRSPLRLLLLERPLLGEPARLFLAQRLQLVGLLGGERKSLPLEVGQLS